MASNNLDREPRLSEASGRGRLRFVVAVHLLFACASAAEVRIGVLGLFRPERLTVQPGTAMLRISAGDRFTTLEPGRVAGMHAVGAEVDLFAKNLQNSSRLVKVSGLDGKAVHFKLAVPGKVTRDYFGTLVVSAERGTLTAVISIASEVAVAAAVSAEMPGGTPSQALQAMAVLARSYYAASIRRHTSFDFCDTTHCQFHRSPPPDNDPAMRAAEVTRDVVLTYNGEVFSAMYSASCGGRTRSAAEAGVSGEPFPYQGVDCVACAKGEIAWERTLPRSLAEILLLAPTEANRLSIVRKLGWSALPSNNYSARVQGDEIFIKGKGAGHGVGVCQRGAVALAKEGADYRSILHRYLPGIDTR